MTAFELMLSESQERMLLVTAPERVDEVAAIFARWDLECVRVTGTVTDDGMVRIIKDGEVKAELSAMPLGEASPVYRRPLAPPAGLAERQTFDASTLLGLDADSAADWIEQLRRASQRGRQAMDLPAIRSHGAIGDCGAARR